MIPKHIILTYKVSPDDYLKRIQNWNPEFEILFFNDEQCHDFIAQHFDHEVLTAYKDIKPVAYKADIFRYCALYILGGIYSDIYVPYKRSFSSLWDLSLSHHYLIQDSPPGNSIQISTMACPPKSSFMAMCLEMAVSHILQRTYSKSPYAVTGPALAGECLRRYIRRDKFELGGFYNCASGQGYPVSIDYQLIQVDGEFSDKVSKRVFIDRNQQPLFPYKYNKNRIHWQGKGHYYKAWHNKNIYGEKKIRVLNEEPS